MWRGRGGSRECNNYHKVIRKFGQVDNLNVCGKCLVSTVALEINLVKKIYVCCVSPIGGARFCGIFLAYFKSTLISCCTKKMCGAPDFNTLAFNSSQSIKIGHFIPPKLQCVELHT